MKFATAEPAPKPKTEDTPKIALFYAFIIVVMAVAQLFSFEKFIPLIEGFNLPGGHGVAALLASLIVIVEVFSLPFLLRMKLSPLMRVVSMVCGWLVAALWLKLTIWVNIMPISSDNIGFLGTSVALPIGWWAVPFTVALGILAIWTSWGMWPLAKRQVKHYKK